MATDTPTNSAALNWALLHWPAEASLVVVIHDDGDGSTGAGDAEIWTARSLRIALMQLAMKGSWNAEEEMRAAESLSPRALYSKLPTALFDAACDPEPLLAKAGHLESASRLVAAGSGTALVDVTRLEDFPQKIWEIWAALAAARDVEVRIRRTTA